MVMPVDERRNHRLAGQIDAKRTFRRLTVALFADPREGVPLHEEGRILDRSACIANDESRAFEPDRTVSRLKCRFQHAGTCGGKTPRQDSRRRHKIPPKCSHYPRPEVEFPAMNSGL